MKGEAFKGKLYGEIFRLWLMGDTKNDNYSGEN